MWKWQNLHKLDDGERVREIPYSPIVTVIKLDDGERVRDIILYSNCS